MMVSNELLAPEGVGYLIRRYFDSQMGFRSTLADALSGFGEALLSFQRSSECPSIRPEWVRPFIRL